MATSLSFTGSNINAGNYQGFSFYLTAEGASEVISEDVVMTSLYFPTTTGSAYLTNDVYLNIWEGDGTNAYTYLGSSTNADHCTQSKTATWRFNGLTLSLSKKYLVLFGTSASNSFTSTTARVPVYSVTAENTHTVFGTLPNNPPSGTPQAWAPQMTLQFGLPHTDTDAKLKLKIMTSAQLSDETIDSSQFYVNNDTKQLLLGSKFLVGPKDGTLVNTATQSTSLTIGGTASTYKWSTNIGPSTSCSGQDSLAIGFGANAGQGGVSLGEMARSGMYGTALGLQAQASGQYAIQIGWGTNSNNNTMNVGLSQSLNVQLLNSSGKIPGARMSLQDTTAPTTSTVGTIGQFYVDTTNQTGYMCVGIDDTDPNNVIYTWKQITV